MKEPPSVPTEISFSEPWGKISPARPGTLQDKPQKEWPSSAEFDEARPPVASDELKPEVEVSKAPAAHVASFVWSKPNLQGTAIPEIRPVLRMLFDGQKIPDPHKSTSSLSLATHFRLQ